MHLKGWKISLIYRKIFTPVTIYGFKYLMVVFVFLKFCICIYLELFITKLKMQGFSYWGDFPPHQLKLCSFSPYLEKSPQ